MILSLLIRDWLRTDADPSAPLKGASLRMTSSRGSSGCVKTWNELWIQDTSCEVSIGSLSKSRRKNMLPPTLVQRNVEKYVFLAETSGCRHTVFCDSSVLIRANYFKTVQILYVFALFRQKKSAVLSAYRQSRILATHRVGSTRFSKTNQRGMIEEPAAEAVFIEGRHSGA